MKRSSYRERDYAFGQIMLTLRTATGLTQAELAGVLSVSRRSVADWEAGSKYPTAEHLKQFIDFAVRHQAFHAGQEVDEIRTLWITAHQKVKLDDVWLAQLLSELQAPVSASDVEAVPATDSAQSSPVHPRRVDWEDALAIPNFYGREWELAELTRWVTGENCRLVGVLGLGGIGKSVLSINLMHRVAEHFDVVVWRSLRDAPTCEDLLDDCFRILAPQLLTQDLNDLEQRFKLLLEYLRNQRTLMVLDNLETILGEGEGVSRMRAGYEGYERLLRAVAEIQHQSCVLFTSREKPADLVPLEGMNSDVRTLRLSRLEIRPCEQLLSEKGVRGTDAERALLIDAYAGNPLALKIVAQTITDLFGGEVAPFLDQGEVIFGDIRKLLAEQFERLSALEQSVLLWLGIMRVPASLDDLQTALFTPVPRARLLEAIETLYGHSLIERGQKPGSFMLQSVVLEYTTVQLITGIVEEIRTGQLAHLIEHGLVLAQSREYVRQSQERLLLRPILFHLGVNHAQPSDSDVVLIKLLDQTRELAPDLQGYAPANLIMLLHLFRGHLRGLDLSYLMLRSVDLQGIEMQDSVLTGAIMHDSTFTESFEGIMSLSISDIGGYWAIASRSGEVRIWEAGGRYLYRRWQAVPNSVAIAVLSPDGRSLAGGCFDASIKYWDVASGDLLWEWTPEASLIPPHRMVFTRDGTMLAIAHTDCNVRLWDPASGVPLEILAHPHQVPVITLSPDGNLLVSGDVMGIIRLWTIHRGRPATVSISFEAHERVITGLAFSPAGDRLASASWDGTVKVWEVADSSFRLQETLTGHRDRVQRLVWSADGRVIASSGHDLMLRLWDVEQRRYRASIRGHRALVRGLAFAPDNRVLVSGGDDGTIGVWDVETGACVRMIHGFTAMPYEINWSPDSQYLVCANSDQTLTRYDLNDTTAPLIMRGHKSAVNYLALSRDGRFIASSAMSENVLRLWDARAGQALESVTYPADPYNSFRGLAWSPDSELLAIGMGSHGVQLFDMASGSFQPFGDNAPELVDLMSWSPNGDLIAGSDGGDGSLYVWRVSSGELLYRLAGRYPHLAWSKDSSRLASSTRIGSSSEIFVWDSTDGTRLPLPFDTHPGVVNALGWGADDKCLITGGSDGILRWWDIETGTCLQWVEAHQGNVYSLQTSPDGTMVASSGEDGAIGIRDAHTGELLKTLQRDRPYERLNITGIKGLSEAQKATLLTLGAVEDHLA